MPTNPPNNFRAKIAESQTQKAFTLAEILITLGIMGILAALTIPALIQKSWEIEQKSQFKKAYATLNNAIQKTVADFGYFPSCFNWMAGTSPSTCNEICSQKDEDNYCIAWTCSDGSPVPSSYFGDSSECSAFQTQMKKNLRIAKTCTSNAYDNGCIPAYKGADTILQGNNPDLTDTQAEHATAGDSNQRESIIRNSPAYILSDGIILFGRSGLTTEYMFDINGKKPPNKWGYDLFEFLLTGYYDGRWKLVGYSPMTEKGGISTTDMIKNIGK